VTGSQHAPPSSHCSPLSTTKLPHVDVIGTGAGDGGVGGNEAQSVGVNVYCHVRVPAPDPITCTVYD